MAAASVTISIGIMGRGKQSITKSLLSEQKKRKPRQTCVYYVKEMCGHGRIVIPNETCTITGYSLAITSLNIMNHN